MQNNNAPLDKGRVAVIAEKYQTSQTGQNGQPAMKNRYATVGRATLWPARQGSSAPNVEVEIDVMPLGHTGPVKMYVFWNSENTKNQPAQGQQQGSYQQNQAPNQFDDDIAF